MKATTKKPTITINWYSGYKADERPVSFVLDGCKLMVDEIIDRWISPEFTFFKVLADDGKVYLLKCGKDQGCTLERVFQL
ncbi:hypothetical protein ACFLZM_06965 [Thermodesulfobacteriota bacterium]